MWRASKMMQSLLRLKFLIMVRQKWSSRDQTLIRRLALWLLCRLLQHVKGAGYRHHHHLDKAYTT